MEEVNLMRQDFTQQIESLQEIIGDMSQTILKLRENELSQYNRLYEIIMEKDVKIEELEGKIEDFQDKLKIETKDNHNNIVSTFNDWLKDSLNQINRKLPPVEDRNKDIRDFMNQDNISSLSGSFEAELLRNC